MSLPPLPSLLARNACLFAGAGAGKTHGLLTAALGMLAGAGGEGPLTPGRLCLLTFTEKAAAEMRLRLAERVEALAEGRGTEPELADAFAALGRPEPSPAFWRGVRAALGGATLSTFHAYCARLLRQAPPGAGIPVGFELLSEDDAVSLLVDSAEQCLLALLDAGDAEVEALLSQGELHGAGRGSGLLDLLVGAVARLREEGRPASGLAIGTPEEAAASLSAAVDRARGLLEQAREQARGEAPEAADLLQGCLDLLHGLDPGAPPERLARLEALASGLPRSGRNGLRGVLGGVRQALLDGEPDAPGVASAHAGCAAVRHERTLRRLCDAVDAAYRAALRRGGWMDFSELLVAARDLLRDDLGFRSSAQARIGALLVDEVQDTNGLQLELVVLLAEARAGGPRPVEQQGRAGVLSLPLEPRALLAVGDRKQSIYEFRGADVAVFEQLARKVEAEGGARHFLRANRRSQPALVRFLNAAAGAALPPLAGARDYEVVFRPEEDGLVPVRAQVGPEGCVDVLPLPPGPRGAANRAVEADLLARWLAFLLSPEAPPTVVERGRVRHARGGDVAILLRAFTGLESYLEALRANHIPHRVLREANPYAAPSVLDAGALLGLLADPKDGLRLAAVLRSPFVGLSDASLFRLVAGGRLDAEVLTRPLPAGFPADEAARLERFGEAHAALSAARARLPLGELLGAAWTLTGYRAAVAAGPDGEEALAALERLLGLARRWDAAGRGDAGALARRLLELSEQAAVGIATGVEEARAGNAVQLLSIHAAKGLQWPVVCLADLGTTGTLAVSARLLVDRSAGLAFRPQGPFDAEARRTPRWMRVREELERRERAEAGRLLYVALTRAQDRLVLSGGGSSPEGWRSRLEPALAGPEAARSVRRLELDQVPEAVEPPVEAGIGGADPSVAEALLARLRAPLAPRWEGVVVEAAALEERRRCPRRYRLLCEVGLIPGGGEVPDLPWAEGLPVRHRAARGRLLRALAGALTLAEWEAGVPEEALGAHLAVHGLSPSEARALGLATPLRALAATRALRSAIGSGTILGEVQLALRLGEVHLLVRPTLLWENAHGLHALLLHAGSLPPAGLDAFALTLSAVLHALEPVAAVARVGLAPVDGPDLEPVWLDRPPLSRAVLADELVGLLGGGAELPAVLPLETCQALGCGFRARCHPLPPGL